MTSLDAIRRLTRLYLVAMTKACNDERPDTYRAIGEELHETIDSISHGVDPVDAVTDLQTLWLTTSAECGNDRDGILYGAWAGQVGGIGETNYG